MTDGQDRETARAIGELTATVRHLGSAVEKLDRTVEDHHAEAARERRELNEMLAFKVDQLAAADTALAARVTALEERLSLGWKGATAILSLIAVAATVVATAAGKWLSMKLFGG